MADKFAKANIRNIGSFKSPVVDQLSTVIDKATSDKVEAELNSICDTLYIPMAYGVKIPAMLETSIYYDASSDSWSVDLLRSDQPNIITDVSVLLDGSDLIGVGLVVDTTIQGLTTEKPLFFVGNSTPASSISSTGVVSFIHKPMVGTWGTDATCIIYILDSSGSPADFSGAYGIDGLRLSLTTLLHSSIDGYDVPSVEYTLPFIENSVQTVYPTSVIITHNVYSNGGLIERSSKTRFKADRYNADGTFLGETRYSDWQSTFETGERDSTITSLRASSYYYIYYVVDCEQGHDLLEWMPLTIIQTLARGETIPHVVSS